MKQRITPKLLRDVFAGIEINDAEIKAYTIAMKIRDAHKGKCHSEESKAKMSIAKQNISDETRAKISAGNKGRIVSDETKANMSAAGKVRTTSDETRAKISASRLGKALSDETKTKMSITKKNMSEETKTNLSLAAKKRIITEETRAKMLATRKRNQANK